MLPVTLSYNVCLFCGLFCVQLLPLEEDLQQCRGEQQEALLRGRQLEQRVEELEERNAATVGERDRQVKLMEVDILIFWSNVGGLVRTVLKKKVKTDAVEAKEEKHWVLNFP